MITPGMKVGRLLVLHPVVTLNRSAHRCRCDCGQEKDVVNSYLVRTLKVGGNASCGCAWREAASKNGKNNRTHGMSVGVSRKLYDVWRQMHRRCYDPSAKDFPAWGGRGISVCDDWADVVAFCNWAWASGYKYGLTIERIDNDLSYSPDNCRWIPNSQQAINTRRRRFITALGKTQGLEDWSAETGIAYRTLVARLNAGWDAARVVTEPAIHGKNQTGLPRAIKTVPSR